MEATKQNSSDKTQTPLKILFIPWLAHGHVSPFLQLAKKLTLSAHFSVHFCSTPVILDPLRQKLGNSSPINLVDLHLPPSPELPPHLHTTNGLPIHLMTTLVHAFETATPQFSAIIETLKPNLIIYDINQQWVPSVASSYNIPSVYFLSIGATSMTFFYRAFKHPHVPYPFADSVYVRDDEMKRMMAPWEGELNTGINANNVFTGIEGSCEIMLVKSSTVLEGKHIDFLSSLNKKKIIPLGPLVDLKNEAEKEEDSNILRWLDKKEEASTVYISFGSEYYLSNPEIEEMAHGLERSGVNFIWVVRFPAGSSPSALKEALPEGFLERVGGKGMVIQGWAPQDKILKHRSIGGFLSHCGWNSVLESMVLGVPILAMPMHVDQPLNARLVVDHGVAVEVMRDKDGEIKREEVERVIRQVLVGGKDSSEVKKKARELSELIKKEAEDKSQDESLERELIKLCQKYIS